MQICLANWRTIEELSIRKTGKRRGTVSNKRIYDLVERTAPLILDGKIVYITVVRHTLNRTFHFDIREFEMSDKIDNSQYVPTDRGLHLSQDSVKQLFTVLSKLFIKWEKEFK